MASLIRHTIPASHPHLLPHLHSSAAVVAGRSAALTLVGFGILLELEWGLLDLFVGFWFLLRGLLGTPILGFFAFVLLVLKLRWLVWCFCWCDRLYRVIILVLLNFHGRRCWRQLEAWKLG